MVTAVAHYLPRFGFAASVVITLYMAFLLAVWARNELHRTNLFLLKRFTPRVFTLVDWRGDALFCVIAFIVVFPFSAARAAEFARVSGDAAGVLAGSYVNYLMDLISSLLFDLPTILELWEYRMLDPGSAEISVFSVGIRPWVAVSTLMKLYTVVAIGTFLQIRRQTTLALNLVPLSRAPLVALGLRGNCAIQRVVYEPLGDEAAQQLHMLSREFEDTIDLRTVAKARCVLARDHIFRAETYTLEKYIRANFIEDGNEQERLVGMYAAYQSIVSGEISPSQARNFVTELLKDDRVWHWVCVLVVDARVEGVMADLVASAEGRNWAGPNVIGLVAICRLYRRLYLEPRHGLMPIGEIGLKTRILKEVDRAYASHSPGARTTAIEAAGYLDVPEGLPRVLRGLSDSRWFVRSRTIASLFQIGLTSHWSPEYFTQIERQWRSILDYLAGLGRPYEVNDKSGKKTSYILMRSDASLDISREEAARESANNLLFLWRLAKYWGAKRREATIWTHWRSWAFWVAWFKLQREKVDRQVVGRKLKAVLRTLRWHAQCLVGPI